MFAGFVARMENTRVPKGVMFGELVGGAGCVGGAEIRVDGVSSGRLQGFRHQCWPVDGCSPGRGEMTHDGGTGGGKFPGEMDRCRESQVWTTICRRIPERDGKGQ